MTNTDSKRCHLARRKREREREWEREREREMASRRSTRLNDTQRWPINKKNT
jgi:hypothetical protein